MIDQIDLGIAQLDIPKLQPVIHSYNLRAKHPFYLTGFPPAVTFTSAVSRHPLLDPRYLALHAACAKVAQLSGASEYVDTSFRGTEDVGVFASDGSSGEALWYASGKKMLVWRKTQNFRDVTSIFMFAINFPSTASQLLFRSKICKVHSLFRIYTNPAESTRILVAQSCLIHASPTTITPPLSTCLHPRNFQQVAMVHEENGVRMEIRIGFGERI